MTTDLRRPAYLAAVLLCFWPVVTAPVALAGGIVFALAFGNPFADQSARASGFLLKAAVVGLGFGISLSTVLQGGAFGVLVTGAAVATVLGVGLLLGRGLGLRRDTNALISVGTAICGGSAIAAVAPVIAARRESIAIALAAVFVLNALALYVFPPVGRWLDLSQAGFALWAAVAIHDTGSVIGAASVYGPEALEQATVLKLARALWIIPVALAFAAWARSDSSAERTPVRWPWFIGLFVLAAAVRSLLPAAEPAFDALAAAARQLLVLVLFLIGSGLSVEAVRGIGRRTLAHAAGLWLLVSIVSLSVVLAGVEIRVS